MKIPYYDTAGDEQHLEAQPKFLTVNLRTEVNKLDLRFQKTMSAIQKKMTETAIGKKVAEYRKTLTENFSVEDIEKQIQEYTYKLLSSNEIGEEEGGEFYEVTQEILKATQDYNYDMFLLTVNRRKLPPEHNQLLDDKNFRNMVHEHSVAEFVLFFRKTEKV